jgi:hypothetical protein
LTTPGLRLADPAFANAVSRFPVSFCITYLAEDPKIYSAMTGNPRAQALVRKAISNMRRLKIPFHVNFVLTKANYKDLPQVARYLLIDEGQTHFTILNFYLERCMLEVYPDAHDIFAPLPALRRPLSEVKDLALRHQKDVALVDIPPCLLTPELRRCARFHFEFAHPPDFKPCSPTPMFGSKVCRRCALASRCSRVSLLYRRHVQPALTYTPLASSDFAA